MSTVVVGFDGSAGSQRALAWAAKRVTLFGRLVLVTATYAEPGGLGRPGLDIVARDAKKHALAAFADLDLDDGGTPLFEVLVVDDSPSHALARVARDHGADEIAIGARPGSAEGDVAADLLSIADRPVVVVR